MPTSDAAMTDSAMEKRVAKDDGVPATRGPSRQQHAGPRDHTAAAAERGQSAIEREPQQRGRFKKPRGSLHVWIVHFDAERSSGPLASSDEE
jgi:hypothetical protein